jgi:hypothetical protein
MHVLWTVSSVGKGHVIRDTEVSHILLEIAQISG